MKLAVITVLLAAAFSTTVLAQGAYVGETLISPRLSNDSFLIDMDFNIPSVHI